MIQTITVPDDADDLRIDRFLVSIIALSRSQIKRLIKDGCVLVAGKPAKANQAVKPGQEISIEVPELIEAALKPEALPLPIVYQDRDLIVVDKPAGIVVHPGVGHATGTLVHGLIEHDAAGGDEDRPGIVHRLDRDTSGLLVVARSDEAHERLQEAIRRRQVERRYLALVKGTLRSRSGRIEAPIGRDRTDKSRHSLDTPSPRDAVTRFEVVEVLGARALLDVKLETGRTHQIRVHLEAIELPVCGDPVYGILGDLGLERQFLHASRLSFDHPFTSERIDVDSPLPEDLAAALERARALA